MIITKKMWAELNAKIDGIAEETRLTPLSSAKCNRPITASEANQIAAAARTGLWDAGIEGDSKIANISILIAKDCFREALSGQGNILLSGQWLLQYKDNWALIKDGLERLGYVVEDVADPNHPGYTWKVSW